ncbi:MAG: threonine synthase [Saprospiraceae bacterium]|nr:threonine synthase [Saprospiraceae bacterium]
MLFYSTKDQSIKSKFEEAIFFGPSPDGGLYMPEQIPSLSVEFFDGLSDLSLTQIALEILSPFTPLDRNTLEGIISRAFNFPAPLRVVGEKFQFLELFHGPTLAFKDFGARFMAQIMAYFRPAGSEINILVATSGDTGGAVASAFSGLPGFKVYILFPKGKVSLLQQKQLTTWDENIQALEVSGTFDDCQRLVKAAFGDLGLREHKSFASANSINIARLLPQMVYFFEAFKQAKNKDDLSIIVPSGNFGNLTAGLFAKRMGLPVKQFIAATNINDIVPQYLISGKYETRVSRETLSNAMDVGDPSNFVRILDLYKEPQNGSTWNKIKEDLRYHVVSDEETLNNIREVYDQYDYIMDPHTAVAYGAAKANPGNNIIVSTAHWAKFETTIEKAIGILPPLPSALADLLNKHEKIIPIQPQYEELLEIIKG